jgi:hypothetical protein
MRLLFDKINVVNLVQLVLLTTIGVATCGVLCTLTWFNLRHVANLRHNIFRLFLVRDNHLSGLQPCTLSALHSSVTPCFKRLVACLGGSEWPGAPVGYSKVRAGR